VLTAEGRAVVKRELERERAEPFLSAALSELETVGRLLWDCRRRRSERPTTEALHADIATFEQMLKTCRDRGRLDAAAGLEKELQIARNQLEQNLLYEGQNDPDRTAAYDTIRMKLI
jgi:hypothetical protein